MLQSAACFPPRSPDRVLSRVDVPGCWAELGGSLWERQCPRSCCESHTGYQWGSSPLTGCSRTDGGPRRAGTGWLRRKELSPPHFLELCPAGLDSGRLGLCPHLLPAEGHTDSWSPLSPGTPGSTHHQWARQGWGEQTETSPESLASLSPSFLWWMPHTPRV